MEQVKITERTPLLDNKGNVYKPGYCVRNLYDYKRKDIKAPKARIKEWDFYQISNDAYTVQMTFADISIGGAGAFTLFDRETGERFEALSLSLLTFGRFNMPENTEVPHSIKRQSAGFDMSVKVAENKRWLCFSGKCKQGKITADFELDVMPDLESMVMAVPFDKDGYFYYNQKMNSMPVKGVVKVGSRIYDFSPENAFAVLDWGRGVWPYKGSWYWGNGTTRLSDGKLFGFEIGWGFGDMSAATENMLFYDGKAHKIGEVYLSKDENNWLSPWVFTSNDKRFEMTMTPTFDNFTSTRLGPVGNQCHQVFGMWNGTVVLDDGTELAIEDMLAFCEFSDNRW